MLNSQAKLQFDGFPGNSGTRIAENSDSHPDTNVALSLSLRTRPTGNTCPCMTTKTPGESKRAASKLSVRFCKPSLPSKPSGVMAPVRMMGTLRSGNAFSRKQPGLNHGVGSVRDHDGRAFAGEFGHPIPHLGSIRIRHLQAVFVHQMEKFPTAASRRSLDRVSVPVCPCALSGRIPITVLVGHYPAN